MTVGNQSEFIRIENIVKKFGEVTAVNNVSLNISQGEVFCLLGGSGSGKSTLLRMLAGFDDPTEGRVIIDGDDISGKPPERLPVNMMFQSYALFPHMTVEKNIGYGLRRDGISKAETKQRVDEIMEMVKLSPFATRKPSQLSGGQRQRVALARCIVKRPKVLMLDEPLGALDKKLREETQQELLKIQRDLGLTFIVVTHDQEEAMTMADRIGIMDMGQIVQVGPPRELYENPNSMFIADFVGSLNKFKGVIKGQDGDDTIVGLSENITVKVDTGFEHNDGDKVMLTNRPEKLEIFSADSAEQPTTKNVLDGTVKFVSYMGEQTNYAVELGDDVVVRIAEQNHHMSTKASISMGDKVKVAWPARSTHLFSA
ncbi:ABC transporter ATP-binding protein [Rhodobacteraceae bacterium B1Z28]|uniref:Spermidine/putrescine import ATP-binding protein PotA n=1 Tax=Ruegeria haliotis TaxID=2747601 RepID=A0ABX2PTB8_9RHOB|nr:ABC transporter ATP-binding protein [Ruegeria haliotis]NVO57414.1 ABC transporter ATP-binding protein [Ruegeria haliotis]